MVSAALLSELRGLASSVAPELSASPLYVINQPPELPRPRDTKAYAVGGPCGLLQRHLELSGQWAGPGPAIVLCRPMPRDEALTVLLHELAHLLPYRAPQPAVDLPESVELAALQDWCSDPERAGYESLPVSYPAWRPHHGCEFIRVCIHLWWRAALAGTFTDFGGLCAGLAYGLSPALWYWRALGSEPVHLQAATFAEILAAPEPEAFRELWRADLARWMQQNPAAAKEICNELL